MDRAGESHCTARRCGIVHRAGTGSSHQRNGGISTTGLALKIILVRGVSSSLCLGMVMSPSLGRVFPVVPFAPVELTVKDTRTCHLPGVVLAGTRLLGVIPCLSETLEL